MIGDATTVPLAMSSREVPTTNDWHNPPLSAATTTLADQDNGDDDDNAKKNFLELNLTAASSTPSWDENNTVEVSISLALPLAWNLTSTEDELAVETLVEDVSTAATQLFHDTLDHSITMLDGSPGTLVYEDIAKDADHPTADEKPRNPHPVQDVDNSTHWLLLVNETNDVAGHDDEGIDWLLATEGNHTNGNSTHDNSTNLSSNSTHPSKQHPKEPPSETMLWDWLGEAITKEELYKMVLEFLDIEDQQDWHNASASVTSPLLRDLKAEIRQAIYGYFFQLQQRQADLDRARNESLANASALPIHDQPLPSNTSHHWLIPEDPKDFDDESDHPGFLPSGLWEMFLADTRVELVMVYDTYAWWQLTMIYPVYVHYQASPDVNDDYELLDDTTTSTTTYNNNNNNNVSGGISEGAAAAGPSATENGPYWEPVTDQGTLDFIGRLLQRVLEAAVHSGAFLQSLHSLQQQTHLFYDVPSRESASANIVGEILEVTIPGMEHELDELISPYDDMEDEEPSESAKGMATDPPLEPPWGSGTYTYSILDAGGVDRRQQGGMLLLLVTFCATSGIVLMAVWRNVLHQREMEKGWLLGTEQDVPELLQVGWRQYAQAMNNTAANSTAAAPLVQRAEIIQVFDKSREGYYDNDSMLHGSAMQQSQICDGCSEVPSAPMEYEKHIERNRGREEANAFVAIHNDDDHDDDSTTYT